MGGDNRTNTSPATGNMETSKRTETSDEEHVIQSSVVCGLLGIFPLGLVLFISAFILFFIFTLISLSKHIYPSRPLHGEGYLHRLFFLLEITCLTSFVHYCKYFKIISFILKLCMSIGAPPLGLSTRLLFLSLSLGVCGLDQTERVLG